jgi:hypothetical protein
MGSVPTVLAGVAVRLVQELFEMVRSSLLGDVPTVRAAAWV